ncbi:MAG: DHH family phosphoesterase [Candidatus Hadarchaeales archaeon]
MYMLIGCDDFGFSLLRELSGRRMKIVVIEDNPERVRHLKKIGYSDDSVLVGDPASPDTLLKASIEKMDAVLITFPDFEKNLKILRTIRNLFEGPLKTLNVMGLTPVVMVRVKDEAEKTEVEKNGGSGILPENQLMASAASVLFDEISLMLKEKTLRRLMEDMRRKAGRLAIILQTNPDPDSIASGVALKLYAKRMGVDADIIYDGVIGLPENVALINLLNAELKEANSVDLDKDYQWTALVDVATSANCALPPEKIPTIIIDHHIVPESEIKGNFVAIFPVASTSTIMTSFLRHANIQIDSVTATALMMGLLTDTMWLTRELTEIDLENFRYLSGLMDRSLFQRIRMVSSHPSPEHIELLSKALKASKIKGDFRFVNLGEVDKREDIAIVADYLLSYEGPNTVVVYGKMDGNIYVSARTKLDTLHLGKLMKDSFSNIGSGGGHAKMAGATIPLKAFPADMSKSKINSEIQRRILVAAGVVKKRKRK